MLKRERSDKLTRRQRRIRRAARKFFFLTGVVAVLIGLVLADRAGFFGQAPKDDWDKYHGCQFKVARIIDGDTLDVDCPDGRFKRTRIRLLGVDTPETVKPDSPVEHFGPEASRFTKSATLGKTITLKLQRARTRDTYNRLLGYVILPDGKNLNKQIIATGHGYSDPRFRHPLGREFQAAQTEAMGACRGLWKEATDADLPYYYRGKLKLPKPE